MKKYVVGIVIGAVLTFSGQALADSTSKIGKKVDAEYTVIVDGKVLAVKAVGVEGVSTTPNRALADAVGYDVEFKDNTVYFTKQEEKTVVLEDIGVEEIQSELLPIVNQPDHNFTLENIDQAISNYEGMIRGAQRNYDNIIIDGIAGEEKDSLDAKMEELKLGLERLQRIKAEIEAQQ